MRALIVSGVLFTAGLVEPASATPVNLVANGSFEAGLADWVQSGASTYATNPIAAIYYGAAQNYPTGAYGEAVPADNAVSDSPDAAGSRAAYFVDDFAHDQSLTQSLYLTAGSYRIGFDAYAPANGYANTGDAHFSATIAGVQLADYAVSNRPATTWVDSSGLATVTAAGRYDVAFVFDTDQNPSKDVVIDRVYIVASAESGGTIIPPSVPEPISVAALGAGLFGLIAARRCRSV